MRVKSLRRVKERVNRQPAKKLANKLSAIAAMLIVLPMPLLAANTNQSVPQAKSSPTSTSHLVLATTTPDLLVVSNPVPVITKGTSQYDQEQVKIAAEKKAVAEAAAKAAAQKAAAQKAAAKRASVVTVATIANSTDKTALVDSASRSVGIPASLLAAVWQIESGSQLYTTERSYAGAIGPLQFMPGTWTKYASDGNGDGVKSIYDARDALYAAARLLAANGAASGNYLRAALAYNHATSYADKVLAMAGLD